MPLFHLDWFVCADGYRIEERKHRKGKTVMTSGGGGRFIVPKSNAWFPTTPLQIHGLYRQLADCDLKAAGILRFVNAHGFLVHAKAHEENVEGVTEYVMGMRSLVKAIDRREWKSIADGLNRAKDRIGGVGRLGVSFELPKNGDLRPALKLRPTSLVDALQVQALSDATLGVVHKKCKNPECEEYFPLSGPDAYRSDAEYHSDQCRMRHTYLKRRSVKK